MTELAGYAASEDQSRGRRYPEPAPAHRSQYQRDRDRIIHSSAFRRLEYKTQVFVNHEGDMFRTRLTHSIEVAQIGRTIARALHLNEDLTEAICLAHDLGHTPFGHAGQDELNRCMQDHGGFEHNLQSLRVVDVLEKKYPEFPGLNLMFDTREGILKHCSRKHAALLGDVGERFLQGLQPGLEAQIANIADEIAYNNHDTDDGLRSGLLTLDQLLECELFALHHADIRRQFPELDEKQVGHEIVRRMINSLVSDLIEHSIENIRAVAPASTEDVRKAGKVLIRQGEQMAGRHQQLKQFLRKNLYAHDRVREMTDRARHTVKTLFAAYQSDYSLLPPEVQEQLDLEPEAGDRARVVADYIAGMTDRFAFAEEERLKSA